MVQCVLVLLGIGAMHRCCAFRRLICRKLGESFIGESASHALDHLVCDDLLLLGQFHYLLGELEDCIGWLKNLEHVADVVALEDLVLQYLDQG